MRRMLAVLAIGLMGMAWSPAFAGEARIEEAGLIFDLPEPWTHQTKQSKIPTGQLVQTWSRAPMDIQKGAAKARPGIVAFSTPVPKDANLALLTQDRLLQEPFNVKVPDAECVKCVREKIGTPQATLKVISFEPAPNCQEAATESSEGLPCVYERVQHIDIALEPSWAFRVEKPTPHGPMKILIIHALVDGKFVEITFSYFAELAQTVEGEISPIIKSIRKP